MKFVYCSSQTPGTALSAVPMMPIDQITARVARARRQALPRQRRHVDVHEVRRQRREREQQRAGGAEADRVAASRPDRSVPAARAAIAPSGIIHALVTASPRNTAIALPRTDRV